MKGKCYRQLSLLTPAEKKTLLRQLDTRKDHLGQLAAYILRCIDKDQPLPPNEDLALRIYQTPYTRRIEDLIRSDQRHISEQAERLLIQREAESRRHYITSVYDSYHLCLAYINRGDFDLFRQEAEAVLVRLEANQDFASYILFYNLYKEYSNRWEPTTRNNYEQLYNELINREGIIIRSFLQQWHIHQTRRAFALSNVRIYRPDYQPAETRSFRELEQAYPFPMLDFLMTKAETYSGTIEQRKEALRKMYTQLQQVSEGYPGLAQERLTNGVNLFTLCCITSEEERGFAVAAEMLDLIAANDFDKRLLHIFYFNLCSMKLRYGYIEEGLALIREFAEQFYSSPYGTRFRFLRVYQLLFDGQPEEAYAAIPSDFSASPEDRLYIKLIETIVFFLREDIDLVLANLRNIRQNTDYNEFSNPTYEYFARCLQRLVNATARAERHEIATELRSYYEEQRQTPNPYLLPIVWLDHYLQKNRL